ncbi:MAG TPA: carboxypeptidase regulatory-like domain-containing protein [Silvibacterium sp.]|jgi:plastocyanin|nr:carboxypeptidase regulatory-like domain-containing protein [Silvibacterium sp.]
MPIRKLFIVALCTLLLVSGGCKKKDKTAGVYTAIDASTAGTISGTIHLDGKVPQRIQIDMAQDPACALADANYTEQYVGKNGGLQNVFIYVKDGLGNRLYAPSSEPMVMDQKGCRFTPHVVGVMAGQPVKFTNSDPTMHNVHITPQISTNQSVDISQPPNGAGEMRTLPTPELMIPVRCNNHPWMEAFINVAANPFFAVSGEDGHFAIKGLPPGTYTIVAVHEKLGQKTATVTVTSNQTAVQDFTYDVAGKDSTQ